MIENPYGPKPSPGQALTAAISFDTVAKTVTWLADGEAITQVHAGQLPTEIQLGLGLFTLWPIADGRSRSLRGQGIAASWSDLRTVTEGQ
jgi:hypothetical protein